MDLLLLLMFDGARRRLEERKIELRSEDG
ncbi:uncharacterized protein G2W53_041398 [Senna tora]|uniref:Uncharacterized protein n=1 Tax=Senna tora TaxID=362788 RepID=A0A834SFH2_9FABA|nr:uncharacterized protein G2W53_041398 [Senna tora]